MPTTKPASATVNSQTRLSYTLPPRTTRRERHTTCAHCGGTPTQNTYRGHTLLEILCIYCGHLYFTDAPTPD